jgi:hypothetical protein
MKSQKILDYENSLKDFLELKKNQLNNMINNSIPNQFSNIKTLLWMNFTFLSIELLLISKKVIILNCLSKGLFILITFNIGFLLFSIFTLRDKYYGVFEETEYTDHLFDVINGDENDYSSHILNLITHIDDAIQGNSEIIEKRSTIMHIVTFVLMCSLSILVIIILSKGG